MMSVEERARLLAARLPLAHMRGPGDPVILEVDVLPEIVAAIRETIVAERERIAEMVEPDLPLLAEALRTSRPWRIG